MVRTGMTEQRACLVLPRLAGEGDRAERGGGGPPRSRNQDDACAVKDESKGPRTPTPRFVSGSFAVETHSSSRGRRARFPKTAANRTVCPRFLLREGASGRRDQWHESRCCGPRSTGRPSRRMAAATGSDACPPFGGGRDGSSRRCRRRHLAIGVKLCCSGTTPTTALTRGPPPPLRGGGFVAQR